MLGIKVSLNQGDVKSTQQEFEKVLNALQNTANEKPVTVNLKDITEQIDALKKAMDNTSIGSKLKVFDVDKLKEEGRQVLNTKEEIERELSKLNTDSVITFSNIKTDVATNEIKSLTAVVKNADGEVQKLKYEFADLIKIGGNGERIKVGQGFVNTSKTGEDKTNQTLMNDLLKEQKQAEKELSDYEKENVRLKQQEESAIKTNSKLRENDVKEAFKEADAQEKINTQVDAQIKKEQELVSKREHNAKQGQYNELFGGKPEGNASQVSQASSFGMGDLTQWLLLRSGIQDVFTTIRDGIGFVNDLNKSLTEISVVTGQDQQQVAKLGEEYNKMARDMAVSTKEIAEGSVEFYRQGLKQDEVMQHMITTTQYAKVSNMDFKESAEVLTATVNSMGVDIKRASDVYSYMGDATATGKHMCPLIQ